jgi:competence protein ComEA
MQQAKRKIRAQTSHETRRAQLSAFSAFSYSRWEATMKRLVLFIAMLLFSAFALAAVNINTATKEELDALPGIGPVKAQAIIDYRTKNGPFKSPEDIMKVSGIKEGEFAKLKGLISVTGASTPVAAPAAKDTKAAPAAATAPAPAPQAPAKAPETKMAAPAPAPTPAAAPAKSDDKAMKKDDKAGAKDAAATKEDKAKKAADDKKAKEDAAAAKKKAKEDEAAAKKKEKEEKAAAKKKAKEDEAAAKKDKSAKDKSTKDTSKDKSAAKSDKDSKTADDKTKK